MGITNNRDTTRSQGFGYDALNRLLTATASTYAISPSHCWGESYVYDQVGGPSAWGNLIQINSAGSAYTGCTQETLSVTASAQNRISSGTYDTAGNLTYISGAGGGTFTFNAENQMTRAATSTTTGYVYDGDGKRVEKTASGTPYKLYWYGVDGSILDETDQTGSPSNGNFSEYVFLGNQRIGRRDYSNNVYYYAADHLGTSRVMAEVPSGSTTATLCYDADFYPFGGERPYTNNCTQNYKFTGKERDQESGNDYFGARYYTSSVGRWVSPDRPGYQRKEDPQSMNLYAYVRNRALNSTDPTGNFDCQGSAYFCFNIKLADFQLKQAASDVGNQGMFALQRVDDTLGSYGDHNGVTVKAADIGAPNAQGYFTAAQAEGKTITFNSNTRVPQLTQNQIAATFVHEGTHVMQYEQRNAAPVNFTSSFQHFMAFLTQKTGYSYSENYRLEYEAYQNEGYMEQYLHYGGQIYEPALSGQAEIEHEQQQVASWAHQDAACSETPGGCN